ncbi:50S ribosomal protein L21 [Taurinivorans muris]|uniref:Large ribosomal subunit protein bL21 n=1 Tax=Taurinivorans muris TaxID=2787751 RepID=A0ABY5Y3B9_9BACT|nr:50S ribosomal protein L21 [Mailhella sp.]UWX05877.1 50S ribosomal protein L21 [Desulfovibrionaceae bacterium LT0009]
MYAIIETCGKQFRVQEGNKIVIDRLAAEIGNEVTFDHVVMLGGDNAKFGAPYIDGAKVTAKVIEHGRGEKVIVFKKHRRKSYRKTQGHRQDYTALTITGINA